MQEVKTQSQEAAELYSQYAHDAGNLQFQIKEMEAQLNDTWVKMRNARVEYLKAKKAETKEHSKEVSDPQGVTNEVQ